MDGFFRFISKPINFIVLFAFFLTALAIVLINFLPSNILNILKLNAFLREYTGYALAVLVFSFFLIVIQGSVTLYTKKQDKDFEKFLQSRRIDELNNPKSWKILMSLYKADGKPVQLRNNDREVINMRNLKMITRVSDQIYFRGEIDYNNPPVNYVLQNYGKDLVEKRLNGDL